MKKQSRCYYCKNAHKKIRYKLEAKIKNIFRDL
jgi:hypothetical protein